MVRFCKDLILISTRRSKKIENDKGIAECRMIIMDLNPHDRGCACFVVSGGGGGGGRLLVAES